MLGAALNPLYNGPDESGHVEYVRTLAEAGLRGVTGPEARQLPAYYALATIPWRLTAHQPEAVRVFAVRLLSTAAGVATLWLSWVTARRLWPEERALAFLAACLSLAPGVLFVLSSAGNDPLATALAGASMLAATRIWLDPRLLWRSGLLWLLVSLLAVATKPTTLPVVAGTVAAIAFRERRALFEKRWTWLLLLLVGLAAVVLNVRLALSEPTSSSWAALARFWPVAVIRAPAAYLSLGGLAETFRTWWYGYDYLVRWPRWLEVSAAASAALVCLAALLGLSLALAGRSRPPVPGIVWVCALAQVAVVLVRYGFGDVLHIEMGGAAQAKAFFGGLVPLSLLFAAGLVSLARALRVPGRWLTSGLFAWLLALDALSLANTLWQHYRWWQLAA